MKAKQEMKAKHVVLVVLFVALAATLSLMASIIASAAPNAPEFVTVNQSGNRSQSLDTGFTVPAQAGNVSQLIINDTKQTTHWQGYYGRITGQIVLDDAKNNTLFDWQLASPVGEVFAANSSTINWGNITCVNFTASENSQLYRSKLNASILEGTFNITSTDADGINETFNWSYGGTSFNVGSTTIDSSYNCPQVFTYVNNLSQQSSFKELLLTDNTSAVFTAILERDAVGYEGSPWDFQMIVPENSASGTTSYYFFVELS